MRGEREKQEKEKEKVKERSRSNKTEKGCTFGVIVAPCVRSELGNHQHSIHLLGIARAVGNEVQPREVLVVAPRHTRLVDVMESILCHDDVDEKAKIVSE